MAQSKYSKVKKLQRPQTSKTMMGNSNGTKLKEAAVRKEAYRQYCEWIASGKSYKSFVFDHPEFTVTYKTMERYIKESPSEFPPSQREMAEARSLEHWLTLGKSMMLGEVRGCQPAIFQMFMRNKFGWDKEDHSQNTHEADVRILLRKMESQA